MGPFLAVRVLSRKCLALRVGRLTHVTRTIHAEQTLRYRNSGSRQEPWRRCRVCLARLRATRASVYSHPARTHPRGCVSPGLGVLVTITEGREGLTAPPV